jgi:predicted aldo/keto reductase-like oxidoreductase
MKSDRATSDDNARLSRRHFVKMGGAIVAGGALALPAGRLVAETPAPEPEAPPRSPETSLVMHHRTLGRTGFEVSDISMGCGRISESNVVRYAYDHGVNYFDTAEVYGNGDSESKIGGAMSHLERRKVFISTKLWVEPADTEQTILERFGKCLERLKTEYADALMLHGVADAQIVTHEGFHAAVAKLKADGRLKHAGISSHGPQGDEPDSMEKVLGTAAEDGRFDVMLLVYNFMNHEEGARILENCRQKNIGTTIMKAIPGVLKVDPFDPENPSETYAGYLKRIMDRGSTREEAVARIQGWVQEQEEAMAKTMPFLEKHGLKTEEQLNAKSVQWILQNPAVHTICISMPDFDLFDTYLPLSGTKLSRAEADFLRDYEYAFGGSYCRHACNKCVSRCPQKLPVSTIMRYSYYYARQGRQKYAIGKYAKLGERNASSCIDCKASCRGACPFGVNIQANLLQAHSLLTLA